MPRVLPSDLLRLASQTIFFSNEVFFCIARHVHLMLNIFWDSNLTNARPQLLPSLRHHPTLDCALTDLS